MKSCTDLEQSKRLIELGLDVETSDMHYIEDSSDNPYCELYASKLNEEARKYYNIHYIPAWSLVALLDVLPKKYYPIKDHETNLILGKPKDKWCVLYWDATGMQDGEQTMEDNLVDACYEMILKLYKLNLL